MGDEDDDDDLLFDDGDALAELDLEPEVPPHLRALVEATETGNLNALRAALGMVPLDPRTLSSIRLCSPSVHSKSVLVLFVELKLKKQGTILID